MEDILGNNLGNDPTFDPYGTNTGTESSYMKGYAVRQTAFDGMLNATTTDRNMGNDFRQFERDHARILKMQVSDMLINLFEYTGLPATISPQQIEIMLRNFGGGVCIGMNDIGELVILGRANELGLNTYNDIVPASLDFYDNDYMLDKRVLSSRNLEGDFVVMFNKSAWLDFYTTDFKLVDHYCNQLATLKSTERMNWLQMRSPYIIKSNKNGLASQIFEQKIMNGELFIDIDDEADMEAKLNILNTNVQDRTPALQASYRTVFNEMLTMLGVYNNPDQKRERLVTGEASANNHIVEAMGDIYLQARQKAMDLLNIRYGLNIQVRWNSSIAYYLREMANKAQAGR